MNGPVSTRPPGSEPRKGIVDAHVHLSRWWPEVTRTAYRPDLDYSVPGLLREMDAAGISQALVIQLFFAPSEAAALREGRDVHAESAGRLLPIGTIDPTRGDGDFAEALGLLEREPGLHGIKLYPGYRSFYPSDRRLDPVYELAQRRRVPVLVHQGDTLDGLGLLKFARPIELDEVAGRFRQVRFVLCHLGNPWIDEAVEVVYKNPNVYADTSGLLGAPASPYYDRAFSNARAQVEQAIVTSALPERFLFGSDWPLGALGPAVSLVKELGIEAKDRRAILEENSRALFRLDE